MRTIADLINEWIEAKPNRSAAALARATGIPKSTISSILGGRTPSYEVCAKLTKAIPRELVVQVLCIHKPEMHSLFGQMSEKIQS